MNNTKRCALCGEILDISEFYIRSNGYANAYCKPCLKKKTHVRRLKLKYAIKTIPEKKKCSMCGVVYPFDMFGKTFVVSSGLRSECNICRAKYREENAEDIKRKDREYYHKNKNRWRDYYMKHADHINENRLKNKAEKRERSWARTSRKNHANAGLKMSITIDEMHGLALNTKKCPMCGIELNWNNATTNGDSPTLDRIDNEPEMRKDNVWIICHKCNTAKGAFPMNEFVEYCRMIVQRFGLSAKEEETAEVAKIQEGKA